MIKIKKTDNAIYLEEQIKGLDFTPQRATSGSAGYDVKACINEEIYLQPNETYKFPTGVHIWISHRVGDPMVVGLIFPRSSTDLKLKNTIGVLDSDYQGELFLNYKNEEDKVKTICPGDRIGQVLFTYACIDDFMIVDSFCTRTSRGAGGYGSTGR